MVDCLCLGIKSSVEFHLTSPYLLVVVFTPPPSYLSSPSSFLLIVFTRFLLHPSAALQTLPVEIGDCKRLKRLDVNDNALVELPATIGNCNRLEELLAAHNNIEGPRAFALRSVDGAPL